MKSVFRREEIHMLACLLTSSPHVNEEIFCMSLVKSVLPFLTNQAALFISRGISRSYFSGNFPLSYHSFNGITFKILVKSRGGGTFLSLALSLNVWQKQFFSVESWISFIFLIWSVQFWIWFWWKLTKIVKFSIVF